MFQVKTLIGWICWSVYHSIFLYYIIYMIFSSGVLDNNGFPITQPIFGTIFIWWVLYVVTFKAALMVDSWCWITHFCIWSGIFLLVAFTRVYSTTTISLTFDPIVVGTDLYVYQAAIFWIMFIVPLIILLPDCIYLFIRNKFFPPVCYVIAEMEKNQKLNWNSKYWVDYALKKLRFVKMKKKKWRKKFDFGR